jgi:hypothetical protein
MPALRAVRAPGRPNPSPRLPTLPHVQKVATFLTRRPRGLLDQPFEIPGDMFTAAVQEYRDHMKARGFPLPTDPECRFENFRLLGQTIVKGD